VGIVVAGPLVGLGSTTQRAGKLVHAWGYEAEFDPQELASNLFQMEWPPRSGRMAEFPEIDRVAWFSPEEAAEKLNPAQVVLIQRLVEQILGP
jgi:predicted NUDIX family NTP pyrophosphohydrolase